MLARGFWLPAPLSSYRYSLHTHRQPSSHSHTSTHTPTLSSASRSVDLVPGQTCLLRRSRKSSAGLAKAARPHVALEFMATQPHDTPTSPYPSTQAMLVRDLAVEGRVDLPADVGLAPCGKPCMTASCVTTHLPQLCAWVQTYFDF